MPTPTVPSVRVSVASGFLAWAMARPASRDVRLTTAANPYVIDADAGNQYTSWLSTDLRVFKVDDDEVFFGKSVSQFYPPGTTPPIPPATASAAATSPW